MMMNFMSNRIFMKISLDIKWKCLLNDVNKQRKERLEQTN